jgi:predicted ATPase
VTFLFTDIEGSTRRWEDDPEGMRAALVAHDEVLRSAVEAHGGWVFKHTGDGVCAAFGSARAAIDAAVEAQRSLELPARMGVATGEAEARGDDYFGPVLNRTARVMAAGHGGQVLVAASAAALVSGVDLLDRGEHRLRDLSGIEHLYQLRAEGLAVDFPPLRTVDAVPGNLPMQTTSFVGRDAAVKELTEQVRAHRLVTLTGVGGVGKTRLAVQVAAELVSEFPDGVWLVELAPVGEPDAVADVVATALGVTPQAGLSMTASLIQALSGRRLLVVLDNCEHLLDAAADLVEQLLTHTNGVRLITTSREVLRVGAEHVSSVPSLEFRDGIESAAVALFVERAQAVSPSFGLADDSDAAAVVEICGRLDGIALAIELAAARMVVMSAQDVRDHLGDRFRLLSGSRRGLERHRTLRQAVAWSYDLLNEDERAVLRRCSVFAGGFDLAAAIAICQQADEYAMLDLLDSLARKSLITVGPVGGHARYDMLETIRQFGEEQLAEADTIEDVRNRHARYLAEQAVARWEEWDGPGYRAAVDWVDAEHANLRSGFRWSADHDDLVTASAIASHTAMLSEWLQRFEPIGWTEEILEAATTAQVPNLARLYMAASLCALTGPADAAVGYAQTAVRLAADRGHGSFDVTWATFVEAAANVYTGRFERAVEVFAELAFQPGPAHLYGQCGLILMLPYIGRADEAMLMADETLKEARRHKNPMWIAWALQGYGRAFAQADPTRAMSAYREGLTCAQTERVPLVEGVLARDLAGLEAVHGDPDQAFELFDSTLVSFHHGGNVAHLVLLIGRLAVLFDRIDRPMVAATLTGATMGRPDVSARVVAKLAGHLRDLLGDTVFDQCVAAGEAMELADAVAYARHQIQEVRRQIGAVG